ncbi:hypothetical protein ACES2L_08125 [Bdellovibrio bacteriovorus]
MKIAIAVLGLLVSTTASAKWGLESFYGKVRYSDGQYHCVYTNDGGTKDFKYVYFQMERRVGKEREFSKQIRIDEVVESGDTISAPSGLSMQYIASYCKFLAR